MLCFDDIKVELSCQGYKTTHLGISPDEKNSVLFFESQVKTKDVHCPFCGEDVYMHETYDTYLSDVPVWPGVMHRLQFYGHRYKCKKCGKTFTEDIPFVYPGTRITERAANQIKGFLKHKVSIRAIQEMTGIHWDTIRKIQTKYMKEKIDERKVELEASCYKPKFLAVDEFAIHKGHRYATCVMDLETGDVLWVGKGRTLSDFSKFFEEIKPDTLSKVIAVAMDMNASYHKLVEKYIPQAEIVYDRYHMQAQYGKEVLGVVRLEEARKHSKTSQEILSQISDETDKTTRKELQKQAKSEKKVYGAPSLAAARKAFEQFCQEWSQYPGAVDVWKRNFSHVEQLFDYGSAVRKVMYTTNAVESINSSFRKVTKKGAFPNENALLKLLYLRITELYKKWNGSKVQNWAMVRNQLVTNDKIKARIEKYEHLI